MTIEIKTAFRRGTKRGARCIHSRSESPYMVILAGDPGNHKRRVYEDWSQLDKRGSERPRDWAPVPLVVIVKGDVITLTEEQRELVEKAT